MIMVLMLLTMLMPGDQRFDYVVNTFRLRFGYVLKLYTMGDHEDDGGDNYDHHHHNDNAHQLIICMI